MAFFTKQLSLNNKFLLWVITGCSLILITTGIILHHIQRKSITDALFAHMETQLNDFHQSLDLLSEGKESQLRQTIDYLENQPSLYTWEDSTYLPVNPGKVERDLAKTSKVNENEFTRAFFTFFDNATLNPDKFKPQLIFKSGKMVSHPNKEQTLITETRLFNSIRGIIDTDVLRVRYSWPEDATHAEERYMYLKFIPEYMVFVALSANEKQLFHTSYQARNYLIILLTCNLLFLIIISNQTIKPLTRVLEDITSMVQNLAKGKHVNTFDEYREENELGDIIYSLNELVDGLKKTTQFSKELGSGNFETEYIPLSEEDELGNSLIDMRKSLQDAEIERAKQKSIEEDRSWAAYGHAKFADILRQNNDNLTELSYEIISELVKYLKALQGGIFVLNKDDHDKPVLELSGCFAFDRRKYLKKQIDPGEGLVGACYLEKETVYMTDIPEGYMDIASGMGDTNPRSILIVPLNLNEETYGVIEIASLYPFEPYKIDFVEKIGEVIASTLSTVHNNMRTNTLLKQFQHQSEEMREQEEELRQNMEELQATQEESARREQEFKATLTAVNNTIGTIELDEKGKVLQTNQRYLALSGLKIQEIQQRKLSLFEVKKDNNTASRHDVLWKHLLEGNPFSGKFHYLFGDREKIFFESYTPILDENKNLIKVIGLLLYEIEE